MRIEIPKPHGKSPMERLLRTLAMLLVVLVVMWAFYKNNENVLERVQKTRSVWDETGQMSHDDINFLRGFGKSLKDTFGINCRIQVFKGDVVVPDVDAKTLYLGLSPARRQLSIEFPALMRPALGQEFMDSLRDEHFAQAFDDNQWIRELKIALTMIWSRLTALENKEATQ
mgnify:CR=1 FL=1